MAKRATQARPALRVRWARLAEMVPVGALDPLVAPLEMGCRGPLVPRGPQASMARRALWDPLAPRVHLAATVPRAKTVRTVVLVARASQASEAATVA